MTHDQFDLNNIILIIPSIYVFHDTKTIATLISGKNIASQSHNYNICL